MFCLDNCLCSISLKQQLQSKSSISSERAIVVHTLIYVTKLFSVSLRPLFNQVPGASIPVEFVEGPFRAVTSLCIKPFFRRREQNASNTPARIHERCAVQLLGLPSLSNNQITFKISRDPYAFVTPSFPT